VPLERRIRLLGVRIGTLYAQADAAPGPKPDAAPPPMPSLFD
jgi:hypothetical protein